MLALGASTFAGLIGAFGYLSKDSFQCVTNHIDPGVTFDFGELNYTEVMQMFFNHNGTIKLPIEVHPKVDFSECAIPALIGAGVGAGIGTLWLASHYAYKYRKQANQALESDGPLLHPQRRIMLDV